MGTYSVIKERLLNEMAEIRRGGMPLVPTSSPKDDGEMASTSHDQAVATCLVNGRVERLKELQAAHWRLDAGTYGKCLRCGNEISDKRLEAVPETALCCDCKAKQESRRT